MSFEPGDAVVPEHESDALATPADEPSAGHVPQPGTDESSVPPPRPSGDDQSSESAGAGDSGVPDSVVLSPAVASDPRVADAVSRLDEIESLPLAEQVAVFTDIHRRLAGVLADPDSQV